MVGVFYFYSNSLQTKEKQRLEFEAAAESLRIEKENLKKQNDALQVEIGNLNNQNGSLNQQLTSISQKNQQLNFELQNLQNTIKQTQSAQEKHQQQSNQQDPENEKVEKDLGNLTISSLQKKLEENGIKLNEDELIKVEGETNRI